jgi:pimeloyl-ACP methyl ester carboxylesterase
MTHRIATVALAGAALLGAAACGGSSDSDRAVLIQENTASTDTTAGTPGPEEKEAVLDAISTAADIASVVGGLFDIDDRPRPRPVDDLDDLVEIDNGRMHIRCVGQGDTTVVLLAGWDGDHTSWSAIEPALAERARVCSYDRFGTGTSDRPATAQTFATQASDLHALLDAAGEPGPYVVVGHSFGGAEAVTFADHYREETAGLMLIDASPTTWPTIACSVPEWAELCATMHDPGLDVERLDVFPAFATVAEIDSLGDLPMTVMTAAHRRAPSLTPEALARLDGAWAEGVTQWASLSSASTVVTVSDTGHVIQVEEPGVVVDEISQLLP